MNDLQKVWSELTAIQPNLERIIELSKYELYDDLSGLSIDYMDAEQLLLLDTLRYALTHIEELNNTLTYFNKPIRHEGVLTKHSNGRYTLGDIEFTSGRSIEAYVYDAYDERYAWVKTRIEHNGTDYFLWGFNHVPLDGLLVRVR